LALSSRNSVPEEKAGLWAECTKLAEEKNVSWEEISSFFPRESPATVSGSGGPALKQFLLSRSYIAISIRKPS
jgi:hypothetical protein